MAAKAKKPSPTKKTAPKKRAAVKKFDISENNQYSDKDIKQQLEQIEEFAEEVLSTSNKKQEDRTKKEILDGLSEIFKNISIEDALKVQALALAMNQTHFPEKAPELYKNRADKREKVPDFIRRVYGEYIGNGLSKVEIRRVDEGLYIALYNWLRNHVLPDDLPIPSKSETIDRRLEEIQKITVKSGKSSATPNSAARTILNLERSRQNRK